MEQNSFKNKRILITGIEGFVGKALKVKLESLGAIVFGISRSNRNSKQILTANILDYDAINAFVKESKIQLCFHLASDAIVEHGQSHPYQTYKINIDGTLNVLEISKVNNLEKVIIASTSHVYGKNKVPYFETYTPKPSRPYETSKACADLIAQSYAKNFHIPILIPRFINIYGPGDINFERIIPKTIKSIIEGTNPKMWGGRAMRDYLYIDDAIEAYCMLALMDNSKIDDTGIFNFGSSNVIEVEDLMQLIISIAGKNLTIEKTHEKEREEEISIQYVSSSRAERVLGWRPQTSLNEGILKTYEWYLRYFDNQNR
jgi:CDP-glucose 4,6-dehydratase